MVIVCEPKSDDTNRISFVFDCCATFTIITKSRFRQCTVNIRKTQKAKYKTIISELFLNMRLFSICWLLFESRQFESVTIIELRIYEVVPFSVYKSCVLKYIVPLLCVLKLYFRIKIKVCFHLCDMSSCVLNREPPHLHFFGYW